jgi:hypothetical protein
MLERPREKFRKYRDKIKTHVAHSLSQRPSPRTFETGNASPLAYSCPFGQLVGASSPA